LLFTPGPLQAQAVALINELKDEVGAPATTRISP
jgi:hypothetical protein